MLEAITYQKMLRDITRNQISEDIIGILVTRPDLEGGSNILNSLNYYHHLSGKNINFYLPGFGAYWHGAYPDEKMVARIDGIEWSYSDIMFIGFINDLELYSRWEYSGETELLMLEYKDGILSFDNVMQFHLDNMIRDKIIVSIPAFFQQLFRITKNKKTLKKIRNIFGKDKIFQITKETVMEYIPSGLAHIITQEKYFCVKNCNK